MKAFQSVIFEVFPRGSVSTTSFSDLLGMCVCSWGDGNAAGVYLQFLELLDGLLSPLVGRFNLPLQLAQVHLQLLPAGHRLRSLLPLVFQLRLHLAHLVEQSEKKAFI